MAIVNMPLYSGIVFGKFRGVFEEDAPHPVNTHDPDSCIYQRRHGKTGLITVKEKYYKPTNPNSPAQASRRTKFADAVAAWQALTTEQKKEFEILGEPRQLPGYHQFLSDYLNNLT